MAHRLAADAHRARKDAKEEEAQRRAALGAAKDALALDPERAHRLNEVWLRHYELAQALTSSRRRDEALRELAPGFGYLERAIKATPAEVILHGNARSHWQQVATVQEQRGDSAAVEQARRHAVEAARKAVDVGPGRWNRDNELHVAHIFGNIVASRLGNRGLVHLECSDRTVYCWDNGNGELAGFLSLKTGYRKKLKKSTLQTDENLREIRGCVPGEAVYVNGIVIGKAAAEVVVLMSRGGRVEPFSGLEPKPHGFEKLAVSGPVDITRAWCKSGPIRSAAPHLSGKAPACGRVLVIDHCGHEIYSRMPEDCCGVLAIGDAL